MLDSTNNTKTFFEKTPGKIMIFSANNSAYWTSYYLKKTDIPFTCFIDSSAKIEGTLFNGVPIYHDLYRHLTGGGQRRRLKDYYHYAAISTRHRRAQIESAKA